MNKTQRIAWIVTVGYVNPFVLGTLKSFATDFTSRSGPGDEADGFRAGSAPGSIEDGTKT
jgi:hypothetical protein